MLKKIHKLMSYTGSNNLLYFVLLLLLLRFFNLNQFFKDIHLDESLGIALITTMFFFITSKLPNINPRKDASYSVLATAYYLALWLLLFWVLIS
ncbi:hypothetical protein HW45_03290 [Vibrio sp. ER1A]|nr:hypothetical protein HW45_03290 [Vibrio sp. ER1A]